MLSSLFLDSGLEGRSGAAACTRAWLDSRTGLRLTTALNLQTPISIMRLAPWIRNFGLAGFVFFLVKGLMWLVIPAIFLVIR